MNIIGSEGNDQLTGTTGNDVITGLGGADTINASGGTDQIDGGSGRDTLVVTLSDSALFAQPTGSRTYIITSNSIADSTGTLNTTFTAVEQIDFSTVGAGGFGDTIDASAYSSTDPLASLIIRTGSGSDTITGSAGNDLIHAGVGGDTINAGGGNDRVVLTIDNSAGQSIFIEGWSGFVQALGYGGPVTTVKNAEAIWITGSNAGAAYTEISASNLTGFGGQLVFLDNDGSNRDFGSPGSDLFTNNDAYTHGADLYTGDGGADVYDYTSAVNAMNGDMIMDLDTDDIIDLRNNDPGVSGGSVKANHFIGNAAFSGVSGEYRYQVLGNSTVIQVDGNGDTIADETLRILSGSFQIGETAPGSNILHITGNGAPSYIGTNSNDVINGSDNAETILGFDGNDALSGGNGDDTIDGGAGDDSILYDPADNPAHVTGGDGFDTLVVSGSAPVDFNLVAHGFEQARASVYDPWGWDGWESIITLYDSAWHALTQDTSYYGGTRTHVVFDASQSQPWSREWFSYDAQDRLLSADVFNDDNSHTVIWLDAASTETWIQEWFAYDREGRLDSEDVHYDDGTRTFINVDQDSSKSWSQDWFVYDSQGRLDSEDVQHDDGTRTFINIDQDSSKNWSQDWFVYDSQGRLDSEDVHYDNGTRTFINVDQDSSKSWSQDWFTYDALGRLTSEDVRNDDGSHTFISVDAGNSQSWSQQWFSYDVQGALTSTAVVWDDGHLTYL